MLRSGLNLTAEAAAGASGHRTTDSSRTGSTIRTHAMGVLVVEALAD
jgi:hypothetical protein